MADNSRLNSDRNHTGSDSAGKAHDSLSTFIVTKWLRGIEQFHVTLRYELKTTIKAWRYL